MPSKNFLFSAKIKKAYFVMYVFSSCFLWTVSVLALTLPARDDAKYVRSPPRFEGQSNRIVWFQPSTEAPSQLTLRCEASGDPDSYTWYKNGEKLSIDQKRVKWERAGQSGSILFDPALSLDAGNYQCKVSNIFGTAISDIMQTKIGVLELNPNQAIRKVTATEGDPLTLNCQLPYGEPKPTAIWLVQNPRAASLQSMPSLPHATIDDDGNLQFSYLTGHDGREGILYQCGAVSPVLQSVSRLSNVVQLTVIPRVLQRQPVKLLHASAEQISVNAGATLKLTCIFGGYPLPNVTWEKPDSVSAERVTDINFGKTLVIQNVQASDAGAYACHGNGVVSHRMTVKVTSIPQFVDGPPQNLDLPEEGEAELSCRVNGNPAPTVVWYMNGEHLHETDYNPRRTMIEGGQVLRIRDLNHDVDRGVYQCNASNSLGYVFTNAYVNVIAQPPEFDTPRDLNISKIIGDSADLDCAVSAAPIPKVAWVRLVGEAERPVTFDGQKIELLSNHTIRIHGLHLDDAATFFCNVSNKYGTNRARRRLFVYRRTNFLSYLEPGPKIVERWTPVSLSCTAEADPALTVQYLWFKDDELINFDKDTSIRRQMDNLISIPSATGRNSAVYKCVAKTIVDELQSEMRLIVKDKPGAPRVTNISCRSVRASIKWSAAFDNNDRIQQYLIEYSTDFQPEVWKLALVESNTAPPNYEAVYELSFWVNYTFRVVAINSYGRGPEGYLPGVKCQTPPSYPHKNPTQVQIKSLRPGTLNISWKAMDKEDWNGEKFIYTLRYWLKEDPQQSLNEVNITDERQEIRVFHDMPIYKEYCVTVHARNFVGLSITEPDRKCGYSGEGIPQEAPGDFSVDVINSTTVRFRWTGVSPESLQGNFTAYEISTIRSGRSHVNDTYVENRTVKVSPNRNSATVGHFGAMHEYEAYMAAKNSLQVGPFSQRIRFVMPEGPSGPVGKFQAQALGARTILLTWTKPEKPNGYIRSYLIIYTRLVNGIKNESYHMTVAENSNYHVWSDHQDGEKPLPNTKYFVSIAAETGCICSGDVVSETVETYAEQKPAKPNVIVQPLGYTSVNVTWIWPKSGMPGTSFRLNYTRLDSGEWELTSKMYVPHRSVQLSNLKANAVYKLYMIIGDSNDAFETVSDEHTFHTDNVSVSEPRQAPMRGWHGAAWFIAVICAVVVALVGILVVCICQRNRGGKYPVKKKEIERGHMLEKDEERSFLEYQYGASGGTGLTESTTNG